MPRGRGGGRGGGRGRNRGGAAAAAAAADDANQNGLHGGVNESAQVLLSVPIAQRIMKYACKSFLHLLRFSTCCDAWENSARAYGAIVTETIIAFRTRDDLLLLIFDVIRRAPTHGVWIVAHLVQIFIARFKCAAALGKRIRRVRGQPTILHALCYRHLDLDAHQRAGRLEQLRFLLQHAKGIDVNTAMKFPTSSFDASITHPRNILNAPWHADLAASPWQLAVDGRADESFLKELLQYRGFRGRGGQASSFSWSRRSALWMASNSANCEAIKALVETGRAMPLLAHDEASLSTPKSSSLVIAAVRFRFHFPLYHFLSMTHSTRGRIARNDFSGKIAEYILYVKNIDPESNLQMLMQLMCLQESISVAVLEEVLRVLYGEEETVRRNPAFAVKVPSSLAFDEGARKAVLLPRNVYRVSNDQKMRVLDCCLSVFEKSCKRFQSINLVDRVFPVASQSTGIVRMGAGSQILERKLHVAVVFQETLKELEVWRKSKAAEKRGGEKCDDDDAAAAAALGDDE